MDFEQLKKLVAEYKAAKMKARALGCEGRDLMDKIEARTNALLDGDVELLELRTKGRDVYARFVEAREEHRLAARALADALEVDPLEED